MTNEISIEEHIKKLNVKIPNKEEFVNLSKILPINPEYGENFIINYERGMLLYALITKFQPKTVLEIGTASGYSTACMSWAMNDSNIDGKIFTIDPKSHHEILERKIKIDGKITTLFLSRHDLWKKFISEKWINKIEVLTGYSYDILDTNEFPEIEFSYIDGSHVYTAVKQDFFRVLKLVPKKFNILFDDYVPNKNNGVTKLIDEEISNVFDTIFINTNTKKQRIESDENKVNELVMCLIGSSSLKKSLWETFDKKSIENYLSKNKFQQKRIKIRHKINKKIPFLKNIRFQWWKKE